MSASQRSITRRECAKCGAAVGEVHLSECWVDRHAPIVAVEYVPAEQLQGPVEALRQIADDPGVRVLGDREPMGRRLASIAREALDALGQAF